MARYNRFGPIAEKYEQLQAVPQIAAAYQSMLANTSPEPRDQTANAFLQCLELIYYNCAEIFERFNRSYSAEKSAVTLRHLLWIEYVLEIGFDIATATAELRDPQLAPRAERTSPAVREFITQYERAEAAVVERLQSRRPEAKREVLSGLVSAPWARSIHAFKNIFFMHQSIAGLLGGGWGDRQEALGSEVLRDAVRSLELNNDTFFCQFRLLHQIPELLGLLCIERAGATRRLLRADDFAAAALLMEQCSRLMDVIVACQRPLRQLMLPAEYYRIRENLGQTSGSDSTTLRSNLMRQSYLELAHDTVAATGRATQAADWDRYMRAFGVFRTAIYAWRRMHLTFPRNLLGGPNTVSLIGSKDGLRVAQAMSDRFQEADPFPLQAPAPPSGAPPSRPEVGSRLDQELLGLTAEIAQSKFDNVQNRTGSIFGSQRPVEQE